jgi:hypothetical protein
MKKPDFRKETIELAELSQGFTESLCLIRAEVSRLHVSLLPLFSSFYRFLFSIIDYQLFLRGLNKELISSGFIQGLALNRIELLALYYLGKEEAILQNDKAVIALTKKHVLPFFLNLSIVRVASNLNKQLLKEYSEAFSFTATDESEIIAAHFEEQLSEATQEISFQSIADAQAQLWSGMSPYIKKTSAMFPEYQKKAGALTFPTATAIYSLLNSGGTSGLTPYYVITPLEGEITKPGLPERITPLEGEITKPGLPERITPLEGEITKPREVVSQEAFRIQTSIIELIGVPELGHETLKNISYMTNLTSAIAKKQAPFHEIIATVSGVLASTVAAATKIPASFGYPGTEPETQPRIQPLKRAAIKRHNTPFTPLIEKESALQPTRLSLSEIQIKASNVEKLITETLMQPILRLQTPQIYRDEETTQQMLKNDVLRPEMKLATAEAFRIPSILASIVAYNIQTYPRLPSKPAAGDIYERPNEVNQIISEKSKKPSKILKPRKVSKTPIASAFGAIENLLTQKWHQQSTAFMKETQISRSTYAKLMAELGATGPVRTALLSELATGFTTPYKIEHIPEASTDATFPCVSEPYPSTTDLFSSQSLRQKVPSQDIINVNVSADTAEEDLRDLERKISRILSEQMSESGGVEPIRTALIGELATGFTTPYKIEINPIPTSSVSRQPIGIGSKRPGSQDIINVNVSADTAEEDLRDLERKISRILSEQIRRYYGSSMV